MTRQQPPIPWHDFKLLAFDVESTGVNVLEDRIVTATVVLVEHGKRPQTQTWLIDPGVDIPDEATAIHGITTAHARDNGMAPGVALFEILARLAYPMTHGMPLVAFNAAFDLTMLEVECQRHDVADLRSRFKPKGIPVGPVIDPFVIDKAMDPFRRGKRTLGAMVDRYNVTLAGAHTSAQDALAAARLVPVLIREHPQLQGLTAGELHTRQVTWRRDQQTSLRAYFDRKGTEHDGCDPGWPFHLSLEQAEAVSS
jgi:DNA polymerase III subunit epsilon